MILDKDRAGYIGASDTSYVVRSWDTKTFADWWRIKQGFGSKEIRTNAILTGTALEHHILESLNIPGLTIDNQKIIGRLRVNLDGNTDNIIYEVKTYNLLKGFRVSADYRRQVNVEMYAFNIRKAYIVAYGLEASDYNNWYRDIDKERLSFHEICYDSDFINEIYLPRFTYLEQCLEEGIFPMERVFECLKQQILKNIASTRMAHT